MSGGHKKACALGLAANTPDFIACSEWKRGVPTLNATTVESALSTLCDARATLAFRITASDFLMLALSKEETLQCYPKVSPP